MSIDPLHPRTPPAGASAPHGPAPRGPAPAQDAVAPRAGWQREMERSQLRQWFHDAAPGAARPDAGRAAMPATAPARGAGPATATPPRPPRLPLATLVAGRPGGPMPTAPAPAVALLQGPVGAPAVALDRCRPATREALPHAVPMPMPRAAALAADGVAPASAAVAGSKALASFDAGADTGARPAPHLHLEPDADGGIAAWVAWPGADPRDTALRQSLLTVLREALAARGQRLSCLVCNGQPVWHAGDGTPSILSSTNEVNHGH